VDLNSRKIDHNKVEQGAWVDNIPEWGDLRLRVRGIGNSDYRRLQATLLDSVPRGKRMRGRIGPEDQDRINATCLADTVLLGWENLTSDGAPVPYSKEEAKRLLTDPDFVAFRDAVTWAANMVAENSEENSEAVLGNSLLASVGS
jgi:hypothetical protein